MVLSSQAVFHAGGALADATLAQQTARGCRAVNAPKGIALNHMRPWLQLQASSTCILFSSLASLLGSPGQANYAAANSVLDGTAQR